MSKNSCLHVMLIVLSVLMIAGYGQVCDQDVATRSGDEIRFSGNVLSRSDIHLPESEHARFNYFVHSGETFEFYSHPQHLEYDYWLDTDPEAAPTGHTTNEFTSVTFDVSGPHTITKESVYSDQDYASRNIVVMEAWCNEFSINLGSAGPDPWFASGEAIPVRLDGPTDQLRSIDWYVDGLKQFPGNGFFTEFEQTGLLDGQHQVVAVLRPDNTVDAAFPCACKAGFHISSPGSCAEIAILKPDSQLTYFLGDLIEFELQDDLGLIESVTWQDRYEGGDLFDLSLDWVDGKYVYPTGDLPVGSYEFIANVVTTEGTTCPPKSVTIYLSPLSISIPSTGQTEFYNNSYEITAEEAETTGFPGQDAVYASTDGLLFLPVDDPDGNPIMIHDDISGFDWQADGICAQMPHADAVQYCESLSLGGHEDWRLPSRSELITIVNYGSTADGDLATFGDFLATTSDQPYWTQTADIVNTGNIFFVSFGDYYGRGTSFSMSTQDYTGSDTTACVRCVRGPEIPVTHDFVDNGNGTVTDQTTGYMWTQTPFATTFENPIYWQTALQICDDLMLGGYDDWRVPNIKQLETLTAFDQTAAPAVNGIFDLSAVGYGYEFWSSTTVDAIPSGAWYVDFYTGSVFGDYDYGKIAYERCTFCVRK